MIGVTVRHFIFSARNTINRKNRLMQLCVTYSQITTKTDINKINIVRVSGIFPPVTTPFLINENVAWKDFENNLEKLNNFNISGYVVLGSNGEAAFMRHNEKISLVQCVSSLVSPGKMIVAGVGCESTRETLRLIEDVSKVGAHCCLVLSPSFFKKSMTSRALFQHYSTLADSSPLPLILYNVPANTAIDLEPNVIIDLAHHQNIIGIKDSGGDITKLTRVVSSTEDQEFKVLAGSAGFLYPALAIGCHGGVCALANVLAAEVCNLYELFKSGELPAALDLQRSLVEPNTLVTSKYGLAGLKYAMDKLGYYGGLPRSPLLALSDDAKREIEQVFDKFISGYSHTKHCN